MNITLNRLIKFSFSLTVIGVIVAILSLSAPWIIHTQGIDSRLQAAGQISSSFAAIFGMSIASLALFAYLKKEEVGQLQADLAYQQKLRLQQAIHQYSYFFERIMTLYEKKKSRDTEAITQYNFLVLPAISHLKEALDDASKSDLYNALGSIQMTTRDKFVTNGGVELIYLRYHVKRMIDHNAINIEDNVLIDYIVNLNVALDLITKDNIYEKIHEPLNVDSLNFMANKVSNLNFK